MNFFVEVVLPLIIAAMGGGFVTEYARARLARRERLELEDSKISEAEITASQRRDEYLWEINRKLIASEEKLIDERIETNSQLARKDALLDAKEREITDLKRDLDEAMEEAALARRERARIDTELTIKKAECETCQNELRRLKNLPPPDEHDR